jgi:hypothetical protein
LPPLTPFSFSIFTIITPLIPAYAAADADFSFHYATLMLISPSHYFHSQMLMPFHDFRHFRDAATPLPPDAFRFSCHYAAIFAAAITLPITDARHY